MSVREANGFAYHVGRTVGRYKLESLLGRGAMAEVYKSTHPDLGRDIAVKVLHPFHTQVPGFVERFRHEAQAAASLHHPNIVQVYDFAGTEDGLYYMVMQYINGLSLEEYLSLEKSPLSLEKAFLFFRQIVNALHFAHQLGTIHRDVKPANIMLDTRENAYLSDFGLAKIIGSNPHTHSTLSPGTPAYMAPEQIANESVTIAIDIYAMGVVLYRMLTSQLPYDGENLMSIIMRKATEQPKPPRYFNPEIPEGVEEVILKALARRPEDRYPDIMAMFYALETAVLDVLDIIPGNDTMLPAGVVPLPSLLIDNYKIKREFTTDSARIYQRYLAHNIALDNLAVLTVLKTADAQETATDGLWQRLNAVALLDHPGIAAVTRVDTTSDKQPYVAYEYVMGKSLETKLTEWREAGTHPPVVEALKLVRQLAEALAVAHVAGVVHNDLRPENIILKADNKPVIVGLEIPTMPGPIISKRSTNMLPYAPPEQLNGEPLTERSNIYSLGVILYELLAGHPPHLLDAEAPRNNGHTAGIVPLEEARSGLAAATYQLVGDSLREEEAGGPTTMNQLIECLDKAIEAEQVLLIETESISHRQRRLYAALASVVVLSLLVAAVLWQGSRSRAESLGLTPETSVVASTFPAATSLPAIVPTSAISPTSQLADVEIQLLDPADDSHFLIDETIRFNWSWPEGLEADQQFAVYLLNEETAFSVGTVRRGSATSEYELEVSLANTPVEVGDYQWQVRLITRNSEESLAESPLRAISFARPTPTPRPSPTRSPSATPTRTPTPTIEATTASCVRPSNWEVYTVQAGDALFTLAIEAGTTLEAVMQANCMDDDILSIGQQIWLPSLPPTETPAVTNTRTATPTPTLQATSRSTRPPTSQPSPTAIPTTVPPTAIPTDTPEPPTQTPPPPPTRTPPPPIDTVEP